MSTDTLTRTASAFKLKGTAYTVTSFQLLDINLSQLQESLSEVVSKSPSFFDDLPVVIDCRIIEDKPGHLDLPHLLSTLKKFGLIPVGVKGGSPKHKEQAKQAGLPLFRGNGQGSKTQEAVSNSKEAVDSRQTTIIEHPVRSGQQIYAKGNDLVILGSVSAGSECLADGNIHIYGALRGRALAGAQGDESSQIFCQEFDPELVSIAGQYQLNDTVKDPLRKNACRVFLTNGQLQCKKL